MYSTYHLKTSTVSIFINDIRERGLCWLHGYPSILVHLARLALNAGLPPVPSVKWITTGGENLLPSYITTINKVFPNALVRTHYGLGEGVANFSQTKNGEWTIDDDFAYVEFIPISADNPSRCRIIGTGFSNSAFPLIRYDTGDIANVEWVNGRPKIMSIEGRQDENFTLSNGTKMTATLATFIFKDMPNITEAQVCLRKNNSIELRVVPGSAYGPNDEARLRQLSKKYLGDNLDIAISYLPTIPRTTAGKFRTIVTE